MPIHKELIHDYCCPETTGCQAPDRSTSETLSEVRWGDLPALGTSEQAGEGSASQACEGLPLSLLPLQTHLSLLPKRGGTSRAERAAEVLCGAMLEVGLELSQRQPDPERLADQPYAYDDLARCTGTSTAAEQAEPMES